MTWNLAQTVIRLNKVSPGAKKPRVAGPAQRVDSQVASSTVVFDARYRTVPPGHALRKRLSFSVLRRPGPRVRLGALRAWLALAPRRAHPSPPMWRARFVPLPNGAATQPEKATQPLCMRAARTRYRAQRNPSAHRRRSLSKAISPQRTQRTPHRPFLA